jgi:hypothetical protein
MVLWKSEALHYTEPDTDQSGKKKFGKTRIIVLRYLGHFFNMYIIICCHNSDFVLCAIKNKQIYRLNSQRLIKTK